VIADQASIRLSRFSAPVPDFAIVTTASVRNRPLGAAAIPSLTFRLRDLMSDRGAP